MHKTALCAWYNATGALPARDKAAQGAHGMRLGAQGARDIHLAFSARARPHGTSASLCAMCTMRCVYRAPCVHLCACGHILPRLSCVTRKYTFGLGLAGQFLIQLPTQVEGGPCPGFHGVALDCSICRYYII